MATPEWLASPQPVPYSQALAVMEERVAAIRSGTGRELVWLLEHPALYTAGTSADPAELLPGNTLPVHRTGRGGRYTYHGPGQRIAYVMLDLQQRGADLHAHVAGLEAWAIAALACLGVTGERREGRVGVWVIAPDGSENKIAAIGVRVRRWVSFHGISINVAPDLSHYGGIVPCGIREHGVTSLQALGNRATMADLDASLRATFDDTLPQRGAGA